MALFYQAVQEIPDTGRNFRIKCRMVKCLVKIGNPIFFCLNLIIHDREERVHD